MKPQGSEKTDPKQQDADHIIRATAHHDSLRAFACRTTDLCREAVRLHDLSPTAAAAMGRLMSGVLMLARDLDQPGDNITAIIQGDGPLQGMTVIGEQNATVRGTVRQSVVATRYHENGKINVGSAIGKGTLTLIRDLRLKEPYVGRVALVSGEIAEDLAAYLSVSEQIASIVSLGVKVNRHGILHAGGLMIQLLPDADDAVTEWLESRIRQFPDVTTLLEAGLSPTQMLEQLLGSESVQVHERVPCAYACPCSRERMARNLLAMGRQELGDLAQDPQGIQLVCHFCTRQYAFAQSDVLRLYRDGFLKTCADNAEYHSEN